MSETVVIRYSAGTLHPDEIVCSVHDVEKLQSSLASLQAEVERLRAGLQRIQKRSEWILNGDIYSGVLGHADYCVQVASRLFSNEPDET